MFTIGVMRNASRAAFYELRLPGDALKLQYLTDRVRQRLRYHVSAPNGTFAFTDEPRGPASGVSSGGAVDFGISDHPGFRQIKVMLA